jgi:Protein of unknown function (DUF4232)
MAIGAILAAGCGSHSSDAGSQAASQTASPQSSPVQSSPVRSSPVQSSDATASAAGSTSASAASQAPTPASAPSCATSDLRLSLGDGGAAAGTDFTVIDFTNTGPASCTLYGFPGVSLVNSSGVQIGAAATRNPANPSTLVTLAPGAMANATLGVANAENYPTSACKPTTAAQLKVFPPNETAAIELPFTATGCAVSSAHQLSVTAVAAGAGQTH